MATKKDDVQVPEYDDTVNEFAETQQAAQGKRGDNPGNPGTRNRSRSSPASKTKLTKEEERRRAKNEQLLKEGETLDDLERRDPFTSTMERGLKRRLNGLVHHAQTTGKPAGLTSVADFLNKVVSQALDDAEKAHNNDRPWQEPFHMRTGRPPRKR